MDEQNKDGDSDSKESYGLKISELLKALAAKKSPPCFTLCIDPRNISATLSALNNTGCTCSAGGIIRSKAVLPENICQLSSRHFRRRDHLRESLSSSVPVPAPSPREGQLHPGSLPSNIIILAHLVELSKMLPSGSVSSIGEQLQKQEIHPHILGVSAWTKQQPCELPVRHTSPQAGLSNNWFCEDLADLQRKVFLGASKKSVALSRSQTLGKGARHNSSESNASPDSKTEER